MKSSLDGPVFDGAAHVQLLAGALLPGERTGAEDDHLAGRRSARLEVLLNLSPCFDVPGPDASALDSVCVNRRRGRRSSP